VSGATSARAPVGRVPATPTSVLADALRRAAAGVRWYVRELTGEAAYDRYVAAHADADHPRLTRAQWWRARDDAREHAAHERCC